MEICHPNIAVHTPPSASSSKSAAAAASTETRLPTPPDTPVRPTAKEGDEPLKVAERDALSVSISEGSSSAGGQPGSFVLDLEYVNAKLQDWQDWQIFSEQRKRLDEMWKRAR